MKISQDIKLKTGSMSSKGAEQIWWLIMVAVIAILAAIFIILWFKGGGERAFGTIDQQIGGFQDADKDGVVDTFDRCPQQGGEVDSQGCPLTAEAGGAN